MLLPLSDKNSKTLATILRAVPESAQGDAALHSDQRDTTADHEVQPPSATHAAQSPSKKDFNWWRKHHSSASWSSSTPKTSPTLDTKTPSHISLKGAIGTYKHGKIQWRRKDRGTSKSNTKDEQDSTSKPKIKVLIPSGRRDQPLPALPFFGDAGTTHLNKGSTELEDMHNVSPPSASHRGMQRDSIVSPLGLPQRPLSFAHSERRYSRHIPISSLLAPQQNNDVVDSSASSNESHGSDTSSVYSNHSSETSAEVDKSPAAFKAAKSMDPLPSGQTLVPEGTLQSYSELCVRSRYSPSSAPPRRYTHDGGREKDSLFRPTCELRSVRSASSLTMGKPALNRKSSMRAGPLGLDPNSTAGVANELLASSASKQGLGPMGGPSPTLSEAECDLQEQLASFTDQRISNDCRPDAQNRTPLAEDNPLQSDACQGPGSSGDGHSLDTTGQPQEASAVTDLPEAPPQVPRKSSKRQSAVRRTDLSRLPRSHIASQMTRGRSRASKPLTLKIPQYEKMTSEHVSSPLGIPATATITPSGAETVILNILRSSGHLHELFATAIINRGFYRVFKRHELNLIKTTLRNMSPPAWEFREIAFPGHDLLHEEDLELIRPEEEYTPTTYLQLQKRDVQVIRAIKLEILDKCRSFIRPEISAALMSACPAESARVDDALWRIWTFCKIFGSGKGREDDIVAQMDWLKGGILAHQKTCTFSIMSTDFMNDTLVGVPECFAKGNAGGLSAEELFDMMELWNCLGVLLQGFEGRTEQARAAGVYDNTEISGGDIDGEEMMLDEWCYHLLSYGPATVLKLTGPYHPSDPTTFTIAAKHGWVNWKPPVFGGTRRHFLKEAASRVYEDKIANTYARLSTRDVQRQQSRLRIQRHISELQHRRNHSEPRALIRMSQERPMSEWDTVIRNLTRPPVSNDTHANDIVSHIPNLRSGSDLVARLAANAIELPATRTPSPPRRTFAEPLLPSPSASTVLANHNESAINSGTPFIAERSRSPSHRIVAQPLLPSPSVSTISTRDAYILSSMNAPPHRIAAQPLLPTPSTSHVPTNREWNRYSTGTSMPSITEEQHPFHRNHAAYPELPSSPLHPHPAFRTHPIQHMRHHSDETMYSGSLYSQASSNLTSAQHANPLAFSQHEAQRSIYASHTYENTADKAIYRIVEMGFTPEQAREALRITDLGNGLRIDRAVELLLARQM